MSRVLTDDGLLTWEVFATTGPFSLPDRAAVIFQCLSDPNRRSRAVTHEGDLMSAQRAVQELGEKELRALLSRSDELS
jgi:hypothetical protein